MVWKAVEFAHDNCVKSEKGDPEECLKSGVVAWSTFLILSYWVEPVKKTCFYIMNYILSSTGTASVLRIKFCRDEWAGRPQGGVVALPNSRRNDWEEQGDPCIVNTFIYKYYFPFFYTNGIIRYTQFCVLPFFHLTYTKDCFTSVFQEALSFSFMPTSSIVGLHWIFFNQPTLIHAEVASNLQLSLITLQRTTCSLFPHKGES